MYGQLGHGNTDKQSSPKMVKALADQMVYLLACGNFHTVSSIVLCTFSWVDSLILSSTQSFLQIVVTTDQSIFFWGKNFNRHVSNRFSPPKIGVVG